MKVKILSPLLEYTIYYKPYYDELSDKDLCLFELVGLSINDWLNETPDTKSYFRSISRGEIPQECWNDHDVHTSIISTNTSPPSGEFSFKSTESGPSGILERVAHKDMSYSCGVKPLTRNCDCNTMYPRSCFDIMLHGVVDKVHDIAKNMQIQRNDGINQNMQNQRNDGFTQNMQIQRNDEVIQNMQIQRDDEVIQNMQIQRNDEVIQNMQIQRDDGITQNMHIQRNDGMTQNMQNQRNDDITQSMHVGTNQEIAKIGVVNTTTETKGPNSYSLNGTSSGIVEHDIPNSFINLTTFKRLPRDRTHGRGIIAALNKQRMRELKMGTLGTNTKSAGLENNVILETGGGKPKRRGRNLTRNTAKHKQKQQTFDSLIDDLMSEIRPEEHTQHRTASPYLASLMERRRRLAVETHSPIRVSDQAEGHINIEDVDGAALNKGVQM